MRSSSKTRSARPRLRLSYGLAALALGLSGATVFKASAETTGTIDRRAPPAGLTLTLPTVQEPQGPTLEGEVFRVGVLASVTPDRQRARLDPYRRHLESVLSRPVEFVPYREARGLMLAASRGQLSYAIAPGSLVAATASLCGCVEPLAAQPTHLGLAGLFAALAVPASSSITSPGTLETLTADRLVIVGENSVVAHHIGLSELSRAGLGVRADANYQFASSLTDAAEALTDGRADAALFWTPQAAGPQMSAGVPAHDLTADQRNELRIVWRSPPAIGETHFAHTQLSADVQQALQSSLILLANQNGAAFDAIDNGSGKAFVTTTLSDYRPYTDALRFWAVIPRSLED
ncbi:MAG: PhnD/SsuA/transferrin family substrate-binding protein [Pseudomonadota bacterium]